MSETSTGALRHQSGRHSTNARSSRFENSGSELGRYVVLVPIKPPAIGKSRLTGVSSAHRRALAEAFAMDTVMACVGASSVAQVLAVTTDEHLSARLKLLGADTVPDAVPGDLNCSLRQAAVTAQRRWPGLRPVVVLADMPALRSADLDDLLSQVEGSQAFVPDAGGSGTTLYVGTYDHFDPRFGLLSRNAYVSAGAEEIGRVPDSVRRDVDDLTDLRVAATLGLGAHTAPLLPSTCQGQFALDDVVASPSVVTTHDALAVGG